MTDYFASATIRRKTTHRLGAYYLWSARIPAATLSAARAMAIQMIADLDCEHGELQILTADAPAGSSALTPANRA